MLFKLDLTELQKLLQQIDFISLRNTFIFTILIPAIIFAVKKEVTAFFEDLTTYRNRRFDFDGDPGIGCECYIQNPATGIFKKILVKDYTFHLLASKRWVVTVQEVPGKRGVIVVPYTYAQWRNLIKGSLNKSREQVICETAPSKN